MGLVELALLLGEQIFDYHRKTTLSVTYESAGKVCTPSLGVYFVGFECTVLSREQLFSQICK